MILHDQGRWTRDQAVRAVCLLGHDPEQPLDATGGTALALWQHALALRTADDGAPLQAALHTIITTEQARLDALSQQLRREQDEPAREAVEECAGVDLSATGTRLQRYETRSEMSLHRNLNQLLKLRKIEPEHQSIERFHKTGKLKPRRWDGTQYAPTSPYHSNTSQYGDDAEDPESQQVPGDGYQVSGQPPETGAPTEANLQAENQEIASTSVEPANDDTTASEPVPPPDWLGTMLHEAWPDEEAELAEALAVESAA
jgi:hypothetical protein